MKRVRITIEADEQFVRLLSANVSMSPARLTGGGDHVDVRGVLARVCLAEMRGAQPDQVAAAVPEDWVTNICVVPDERRYQLEPGGAWHKTNSGTCSAAPDSPSGHRSSSSGSKPAPPAGPFDPETDDGC